MSSPFPDMAIEASGPALTFADNAEAIPIDRPIKLKGRAKLLHGLQRISSSPSLASLGRRRAVSNPYGGRAAMSCVSLAGNSRDNVHTSQSSRACSTTPTSVPNTPGDDGPFHDAAMIRRIPQGYMTPGTATPTSAMPHSRGVSSSTIPGILEDYFSLPIAQHRRPKVDYWAYVPHEIKLSILGHLEPKQLVQTSRVSKSFYRLCFDGQLWTRFDASEFYTDIPAESLAKIIVSAGPFVKDLNLRGCVQVEHYKRAEVVVKACKNLINATLQGCKNFQRATLHNLLRTNERLANLNLSGLNAVTNATCKIVAQSCPSLEVFNVSWCTHMDARGLRSVVLGCPKLKDLRAGEVTGFDSIMLAQAIFETNNLERLILSGCHDLKDDVLKIMIHGEEPELDVLTDVPMVPVRKLRHLDLSRCFRLTNASIKMYAHLVPDLEGLQLSSCPQLTDDALTSILWTTPRLTHLDIEELPEVTNALFDVLARAPCASLLQHLSISYCENVGDLGMLPVVKACTNLQSVEMDNTKIGDLVLAEAAAMVRARASRTTCTRSRPQVSLKMIVYDCQNVTWTGIREVLSRNSEVTKPTSIFEASYPTEIIGLKCFHGWQQTVDEHMKRILKGNLPAAGRLERKWTDYMMANEEAGVGGVGARRRRRRAREAQMMHADEEEAGIAMAGIGRRRRARSNGCSVM